MILFNETQGIFYDNKFFVTKTYRKFSAPCLILDAQWSPTYFGSKASVASKSSRSANATL